MHHLTRGDRIIAAVACGMWTALAVWVFTGSNARIVWSVGFLMLVGLPVVLWFARELPAIRARDYAWTHTATLRAMFGPGTGLPRVLAWGLLLVMVAVPFWLIVHVMLPCDAAGPNAGAATAVAVGVLSLAGLWAAGRLRGLFARQVALLVALAGGAITFAGWLLSSTDLELFGACW